MGPRGVMGPRGGDVIAALSRRLHGPVQAASGLEWCLSQHCLRCSGGEALDASATKQERCRLACQYESWTARMVFFISQCAGVRSRVCQGCDMHGMATRRLC